MQYVAAINDDGSGVVDHVFSTDGSVLDRFAQQHNKPGRSVYQCVGVLKDGAQHRNKDTVASIDFIHVDVDLRSLVTPQEQVLAKLKEFREILTFEVRESGGGYHIIVWLKETAHVGTSEYDKAVALRTALTNLFCGDPAPNHSAALLRRLGSFNYKYGEPRQCRTIVDGLCVDLAEVEAFVELCGKPQFERKETPSDSRVERADRKDALDDDSTLAELNKLALKNLALWVPALDLYNCKRRMGRYPAYDAVPEWRPSTTGRPLDQRKRNLGIVGSGIKDFGTGEGLSPIDVVMRKLGLGVHQAACWLEEKLPSQSPDIDIDIDKCVEAQDAPSTVPGDDDGGEPDKGNGDDGKTDKKEDVYDLKPYELKHETETKPRAWVAYKHYLLGTVSSTVAPGAVGKTSNNLVEACSMALGRDLFTGQALKRRYRVWYHSAEETPEEMDLRLAAISKKYGFTRDDLGDWLFVTCGFDVEIKASTKGRDAKLSMPTRAKIIRTIIARLIEVAIFDPLAAMHSMPEKDNVAMADLIYDFFGPIAYQTKSAIEIVHHTRKGPAGVEMEYTAADWRGGSASTFALRGVRVCNVMKKSEAANFDIEENERLSYFRLTRGKNNMTRMGDVGWRQFVSVTLQNGNPEIGDENEEVGVVVSWQPPADAQLGMYGQEDKDYWRNLVAVNNAYGVHPQSKEWFGCEIAKRLNLDLVGKNRKAHHKIAKAILWELIETGWFKIVLRVGDDRREHQYLDIGDEVPEVA